MSQSSKEPRVIRKRNRRSYNCTQCRLRKLKCDRQQPCDSCIRRGLPVLCVYSSTFNGNSNNSTAKNVQTTSDEQWNSTSSNTAEGESNSADYDVRNNTTEDASLRVANHPNLSPKSLPDGEGKPIRTGKSSSGLNSKKSPREIGDLLSRLDRMEQFVDGLIKQRSSRDSSCSDGRTPSMSSSSENNKSPQSPNDLPEDVTNLKESLGMMKLHDGGQSLYHGGTHWTALLSHLPEIKTFFQSVKCDIEDFVTPHEAMSIMQHPHANDLFYLKPPKEEADVLIERFRLAVQPIFHILHWPSFLEKYEQFYIDSSKLPKSFAALIFSVFAMSLESNPYKESMDKLKFTKKEFLKPFIEIAQICLKEAHFFVVPSVDSLRAVLLLTLIKGHLQLAGRSYVSIWTGTGTAIRVAQLMGLHRDPKWFSLIPFEAEERRRTWSILSSFDIYASIMEGLPLGIKEVDCDTGYPSNLNDEDLLPLNTYLPHPSYLTVRTDYTFEICMARMKSLFRDVYPVGACNLLTFTQLGELDAKIQSCFGSMPPFLRDSVLDSSLNENPNLLIQRLLLQTLYLKTLITLHRPSGNQSASDPRFASSRDRCMQLSCKVIQLQIWFMQSEAASECRRRFLWVTGYCLFPIFCHANLMICIEIFNHYDQIPNLVRTKYIKTSIAAIKATDDLYKGMDQSDDGCLSLVLNMFLKDIMNRIKHMESLGYEKRQEWYRARNVSNFKDGDSAVVVMPVQARKAQQGEDHYDEPIVQSMNFAAFPPNSNNETNPELMSGLSTESATDSAFTDSISPTAYQQDSSASASQILQQGGYGLPSSEAIKVQSPNGFDPAILDTFASLPEGSNISKWETWAKESSALFNSDFQGILPELSSQFNNLNEFPEDDSVVKTSESQEWQGLFS